MKIDNCKNVLDSRDIISRLEELESDFEDWKEEQENELGKCDENSPQEPVQDSDFDDWDELETLRDLAEQCKDGADWEYGEVLIHEDYFVEYCREMIDDIGDLPKNLPWYIENNIDWKGVAEDLKVDYIEVDFAGENYLIRG